MTLLLGMCSMVTQAVTATTAEETTFESATVNVQ